MPCLKTKEVNRIQLAGNEIDPNNNYNELLHQWPRLIPAVAWPALKNQTWPLGFLLPQHELTVKEQLIKLLSLNITILKSLFSSNSKVWPQIFCIPLNWMAENMLSSRKKKNLRCLWNYIMKAVSFSHHLSFSCFGCIWYWQMVISSWRLNPPGLQWRGTETRFASSLEYSVFFAIHPPYTKWF